MDATYWVPSLPGTVLPTIYALSLFWKPSDKTGIAISILSVVGSERLNIQVLKLRRLKFGPFHSCIWNVSDGWFYKELYMYWILLILIHCGWKRAFLVNVYNCGTSLSMLLYLKPVAPGVVGMCLATPGIFSFVGEKQDSPMQLSPYMGPLKHLLPPTPPRFWLVELLITSQFSCSVMSDSLQPHGLQHTRLPCLSPTPAACSNSCPPSWWYYSTISSSVITSSCLQSFPASGSLPMCQFFAWGGQSIGVSASASVFPMNIHHFWISEFKGFMLLLKVDLDPNNLFTLENTYQVGILAL